MRCIILHSMLSAVLLTLLLLPSAPGCSRIERAYYLESGKYVQGIEALSDEYALHPWDPELNYYLGRFHLGLGQGEQAVGYLKRATILVPDQAEYHYWLAMAHLDVGEPLAEERELERALSIDTEHVQARLALANNLLGQNRAIKALTHYDMVLAASPANAEALWGRAKALGRLGRASEHRQALHAFLGAEPEGARAAAAVDELNAAGDFSWRTHTVGRKRLVLPAVEFAPGTDSITVRSQAALDIMARELEADKTLRIHVVAFAKDHQDLARRRALALTESLRQACPRCDPERLVPSWLGQSQQLRVAGATRNLDESILFITYAKKEGA